MFISCAPFDELTVLQNIEANSWSYHQPQIISVSHKQTYVCEQKAYSAWSHANGGEIRG